MKYEITEEFLNKIIERSARSLVGKACKRFEILEKKEDIKRAIKELVYESYREFKELVKSFNYGVKFINRGE